MTNDTTLRAWWWHRQGLDGSLTGAAPDAVLERCGWARSVGGVGPYLALFARAGLSRADADAAVARLDIHELPAARGCTYVIPARDFALALRVGHGFAGGEMRTAAKVGVTADEIERLCAAVLGAVGDGPLDPETLRARTGDASRSLGAEGKKKGLTTTLPIALGLLQSRGDLRRVPVNGRLDQQRYGYVRWSPSPLAADTSSAEEAFVELARRFFSWVGPATMKELQWFTGLGVKAAAATAAPLGLVPAWEGSDRLLLPTDAASFREFEAPAEPRYALVSSLDPIIATRRDVATLLSDADRDRRVLAESGEQPVGLMSDLPSHAILDRGRLVGLWEYDVERESIAWGTFGVKTTPALRSAVKATEEFVRGELGDARSFSLDSPKSRVKRVEAVRAMG